MKHAHTVAAGLRASSGRRRRLISVATLRRGLSWLQHQVRNVEFLIIPLAIVIGITAGITTWLMSEAAQLAHVALFGIKLDVRLSASAWVNPWVAVLAPAAGGLLLGISEHLRARWKWSVATDPVEANALRGGKMSLRDSLVLSGQTLLSNGCGASVGLEAGYTQMGTGFASSLGQYLKLRRADLRLLVGCGAAGAISAAFGAPFTGAFYACELIVGVYSVSSAAPILAASIAAAYSAQMLGGAPYMIHAPELGKLSAEQFGAFLILALLCSGLGVAVMRSSALVERAFARSWLPKIMRPCVGGAVVGGLAIFTPQVLAAGHGAMMLDLTLSMPILGILAIIAFKLAACLVSLASGFRGGLFFASLFVGSLVGKAFAMGLQSTPIGWSIDETTVALVGMASLGVAIVGGPLTMSFLVLELTRNVDVTAAALAASVITSVCVRATFGHSFSTWRLHLRGENVRGGMDIGWGHSLKVERLMRTDHKIIEKSSTIAKCREKFVLGSCQAVFVVDAAERYLGTIMLSDLFSEKHDATADVQQVGDLVTTGTIMLRTDTSLSAAMMLFDESLAEVLAVSDLSQDRCIVGFLTETFTRRRYLQEFEQATKGVFGFR